MRLLLLATSAAASSCSLAGYAHYRWNILGFDDPHYPEGFGDAGGFGNTEYVREVLKDQAIIPVRPVLTRNDPRRFDVCVIGGGYAGLHSALALAERGQRVVILEALRIGSGASGRNGGDALVGFQIDPSDMARYCGEEKAKQLYQQSIDGYDRLQQLITKYHIPCQVEEHGCVTLAFRRRFEGWRRWLGASPDEAIAKELDTTRNEVEKSREVFGQQGHVVDKATLKQSYGFSSNRFVGGVVERRNASLNPLALALGLAKACESHGVKIYESSPALSVDCESSTWKISTPCGSVVADHVILATAGAPARLCPQLAAHTAPFSTAIVVTKPLDHKVLNDVFNSKVACFDERFGLAYFRRISGDRILYGGLCSGLPMNLDRIEKRLLEDLSATFPSLRHPDGSPPTAERCWQGRIEAAWPLFPLVGQLPSPNGKAQGLYYSLGFCGHGIVPTCAAGEVLAKSIVHQDDAGLALWSSVKPRWWVSGGPWGLIGSALFGRGVELWDRMNGRW